MAPLQTAQPWQADPAADIFKRAIRLLAEAQGDAWVNQSALWQMIRRLDSTFDPKEHGHVNFLAMHKAFDAMLEVKEGESGPLIRLR